MRHFAITGIETDSWISVILSGSAIRATPPSARMSAGTRSSAITAHAPASSAIRACSASVTSMITPPFSISARPLLTLIVPVSAIGVILAVGPGGLVNEHRWTYRRRAAQPLREEGFHECRRRHRRGSGGSEPPDDDATGTATGTEHLVPRARVAPPAPPGGAQAPQAAPVRGAGRDPLPRGRRALRGGERPDRRGLLVQRGSLGRRPDAAAPTADPARRRAAALGDGLGDEGPADADGAPLPLRGARGARARGAARHEPAPRDAVAFHRHELPARLPRDAAREGRAGGRRDRAQHAPGAA